MSPIFRTPCTPARGVCFALGLPIALGLAFPGCRSSEPKPEPDTPAGLVDRALTPREFARALAAAGGARVRATTRLFAQAQANDIPNANFVPAQDVTTETELWLDASGDYRLVESNDQDGGREIIRKGGDLFVALRYGKRIQRTAREPETGRYLEEALGGPWAVWELARQAATVTLEDGADQKRLVITLSPDPPLPTGTPAETGLRAWRTRTRFSHLSGAIVLRKPSGLVESAGLEGTFVTQGTSGTPDLTGGFAVRLAVTDTGTTSAIDIPDAEPLPRLQRTLIEERLLDGLPGRRDPAQTPLQESVQNRITRPTAPPAHPGQAR